LCYTRSSIKIPKIKIPKIKMNSIVYSKDNCPYCEKIKQVFELANIEYLEYKLDINFNKEEFYSEFGQGSTFPQIIINNMHIGGCTETIKYLMETKVI
jgi:glutaredoxin 3